MRKLALITVMTVSVLVLAACGKKNNDNGSTTEATETTTETTTEATTEATSEETTEATTEATSGDNSGNGSEQAEGSLGIFNAIWNAYGDDQKFPAAGGDYSEENMAMDAPGKYGLGDASMLYGTFHVPEADVALIDDAASLMHMMNSNTFTGAVFHIADSAELEGFAERLKDSVLATQWMCGFPDQLVIYQIDDYVISAFGNLEIINTFEDKVLEVYTDAVQLYSEQIM